MALVEPIIASARRPDREGRAAEETTQLMTAQLMLAPFCPPFTVKPTPGVLPVGQQQAVCAGRG
jgi:hypothetical protein